MSQPPIHPVFISYSRHDKTVMQRIVAFLRKQGINVWLDNEKLTPGTPIWEEEIEKAIKAASAIVVVMSPDAKNSEWVRREITFADQYQKHIVPVLVSGDQDSAITLRLVTRQYVDIRQNEETGLNSLLGALSQFSLEFQNQALENTTDVIQDRKLSEDSERITTATSWNTIAWATAGWAIAGGMGGFMYNTLGVFGEIGAGVIGGIIGGLITLTAFRNTGLNSQRQKNIAPMVSGWAVGGAIGWVIGFGLTEAIGAGIGVAIFAMIGLASTLGMEYIRLNWKISAVVAVAWLIGEAIGWFIARRWMIDSLGIDSGTAWAMGTAIGWAIGGFVMIWQTTKSSS